MSMNETEQFNGCFACSGFRNRIVELEAERDALREVFDAAKPYHEKRIEIDIKNLEGISAVEEASDLIPLFERLDKAIQKVEA